MPPAKPTTHSPFHQARSIPSGKKEDHLSQRTSAARQPPTHHIHKPMGAISVQNYTPGLSGIRRWMLKTVQADRLPHP